MVRSDELRPASAVNRPRFMIQKPDASGLRDDKPARLVEREE